MHATSASPDTVTTISPAAVVTALAVGEGPNEHDAWKLPTTNTDRSPPVTSTTAGTAGCSSRCTVMVTSTGTLLTSVAEAQAVTAAAKHTRAILISVQPRRLRSRSRRLHPDYAFHRAHSLRRA